VALFAGLCFALGHRFFYDNLDGQEHHDMHSICVCGQSLFGVRRVNSMRAALLEGFDHTVVKEPVYTQ
jgi:hypothetical protein